MNTQRESSKSTGRESPDSGTSGSSRQDRQARSTSMSSAAASPASLFRMRVGKKLKVIRAGSGRSSPVSSVSFNLGSSSSRTFRACSLAQAPTSCLILPRSGSMRNGELSLRKTSALRTYVSGCLWLLPTPVATEHCSNVGGSAGRVGRTRYSLIGMARYGKWPTPKASDGEMGLPRTSGRPVEKVTHLATAVRYWATPAARDYRHPNKKPYAERGGGKKGEQLPNQVGGPLNPTWVEWLMGFPLGWTDLDASATPSSPKSPSGSADAS